MQISLREVNNKARIYSRFGWFGCLGFMAYQPLLVIQRQIHFYTNNQFYYLIAKNISISSNSVLFQTILIQKIPFSISVVFVYTQLNAKTVLFQVIQFCLSTQLSSI